MYCGARLKRRSRPARMWFDVILKDGTVRSLNVYGSCVIK